MHPSAVFVSLREFALANSRRPLMRALIERGWRVIAATDPEGTGSPLLEDGVEVASVPFIRGGVSGHDMDSFRTLHRLYREISPQLIHHFNAKAVVYGGLAARGVEGVTVVHTITGLGHAFTQHRLSRLSASAAYRLTGPRADAIVFQNAADRDLFIDRGWVDPRRARLIVSSGVDIKRYAGSARDAGVVETVLMASRLLWSKGVREFVEAAKILRRRGHGAPIKLGGEWEFDHPDSVGRDYIAAAQSEAAITFCGYIADVPAALADAALVVAPSYYREGVPRVLLEAAASGRPVVAANTPAAQEVVLPGKTGLLVPPGDSTALADAIEALLQDPEQRSTMGEAAYEHVATNFSLQAVTEKQLEVYRDLGLLDEEARAADPPDQER